MPRQIGGEIIHLTIQFLTFFEILLNMFNWVDYIEIVSVEYLYGYSINVRAVVKMEVVDVTILYFQISLHVGIEKWICDWLEKTHL